MKLIDVDALNLDHEVEMADDWKTAHEIANHIRYAPTVEAIPVEWIEKWLDEFLGVKLEEDITNLDPFKKNVYKCISVTYPALYYACDNYLTTGSLQRALMAGGCEHEGFIREVATMVEI